MKMNAQCTEQYTVSYKPLTEFLLLNPGQVITRALCNANSVFLSPGDFCERVRCTNLLTYRSLAKIKLPAPQNHDIIKGEKDL